MKRLLRIIMWFLFFIALAIVGAYFLPRVAEVERSMVIEAPAKMVFAQINDLHSWDKWSKWSQLDPDMRIEYRNHGVGEEAVSVWESDSRLVGNGQLIILESASYDSIVVAMNFEEQDNATSVFYFEDQNDSTTLVRWKAYYDLGFNPAARWMGLLKGSLVGPDFKESLDNLNVVCAVQVQENTFVKELITLESFDFASVRREVPFLEVSLVMNDMYANIGMFLESENIGITGAPFAVYHEIGEEEIDLECGIPVSENVEGNEQIITGTYPSTTCAAIDYYGDYQQLEDAHTALQAWIEQHNFRLAGSPIEFYLTDQTTEPDPEKWLTRICYPVR